MPPTPKTPEGARFADAVGSHPIGAAQALGAGRFVFYGHPETMGVKISATDAALLGLLTRGELSGYDLQRAAEANGGLFWAPAKSRIYAVLPQLVTRGFATSREVVQTGRPNKQLYRLTKSGRAALQSRHMQRLFQ